MRSFREGSRRLLIAVATLVVTAEAGATQSSESAKSSDAIRYCSDLRQVTMLAAGRSRFSSIAGKERHGNFRDTSLSLPGWKDCSLYGDRTYTCDSAELLSRETAEAAQSSTLAELKICLGAGWSEALDRSSPNYVVLHSAGPPVSITLSTDETEHKQHVVRIIVFRRGD